jgi:hypothetical protein
LNAALTHQKYNLVVLMAGTNDAIRDVDSKVVAFAAVFAVAVVLFFNAVYFDNDVVAVDLWYEWFFTWLWFKVAVSLVVFVVVIIIVIVVLLVFDVNVYVVIVDIVIVDVVIFDVVIVHVVIADVVMVDVVMVDVVIVDVVTFDVVIVDVVIVDVVMVDVVSTVFDVVDGVFV